MHRPPSVEIDGARLRELRKIRGLSIADLAKAARISSQTVSAVERGTRRPMPAIFGRICNVLELRTDDERRTLIRDDIRSAA